MALLQNKEYGFPNSSYLTNVKDGIGERLINLNCGFLNDPSFRAAGWTPNIADIKRTYSPPIPTAITSDYFSAPPRSAGFAPSGFNDEDEEGGMVTGRGSTDTVGPGPNLKRRRRREQHEEDDSSDLSDESDEDTEGTQRAAQQIKFAKMPLRDRSGSSPIRSSRMGDEIEVLITSPSKKSGEGRLRSDSMGAVEVVKQRARKDTITSSDMSSDNELDNLLFKRRQINQKKEAKASNLLTEKHKEDELLQSRRLAETIDEDTAEDSDRSSLSSAFAVTGDSESLLDDVRDPLGSSPLQHIRPPMSSSPEPSKKVRYEQLPMLQTLPPPRPISKIQPVSLLGQAIRAQRSKPKNPVERFARLSAKGALDPLNIRIYVPFSEHPNTPIDMPLQRIDPDGSGSDKPQVIVAEAIGLCLWRYYEEGLKPLIETSKLNVNRWTLRMIEDGEVDFDFPALSRTRPIVDFTSNNNRGARGRSREKPYDEFALVEATDIEFKENQALTPKYDQYIATVNEESNVEVAHSHLQRENIQALMRGHLVSSNSNINPVVPAPHSTPRMGPPKMLKVHFTSLEAFSQITTIEVSTDTYIAEVLDMVCKRWNLDRTYHTLKVSGTNTVAPVDRMVEALGARTDLDLVRCRFANEGAIGLAGSPGSNSPNAPLLLTADTPRRGKRTAQMMQPLVAQQDVLGISARHKKYNVVRKQPMSFASSHHRILLMDEDCLHILPGEAGKTLLDPGVKTSRVPFSVIIGCKVSRRHPKMFRVIVLRDRETKRYDFEAPTAADAAEIVLKIEKGMELYHANMQLQEGAPP